MFLKQVQFQSSCNFGLSLCLTIISAFQAVMLKNQRNSSTILNINQMLAKKPPTYDSHHNGLTMIPLKAVLAHASTSWDGAWPLEPLDITVWEKVPVGGRLAPTGVGPGGVGGFGGPWVRVPRVPWVGIPEVGGPAAGL